MSSDRAALVEAVAQAISNAWDSEQRIFEAAEVAIDLIRAEVLEEAARVAVSMTPKPPQGVNPDWPLPIEIAAAIRALKEK